MSVSGQRCRTAGVFHIRSHRQSCTLTSRDATGRDPLDRFCERQHGRRFRDSLDEFHMRKLAHRACARARPKKASPARCRSRRAALSSVPTASASTGSRLSSNPRYRSLARSQPQRQAPNASTKQPRHHTAERLRSRGSRAATQDSSTAGPKRGSPSAHSPHAGAPASGPSRPVPADLCASRASRNWARVIQFCSSMSSPSGMRWRCISRTAPRPPTRGAPPP